MNSDLALYNFQKEDTEKMSKMSHVLLFSDMGTGKTIEAIWHVKENNLLPCLIICPNSLKLNWWDEIKKWTGIESVFGLECNDIVDYYYNPKLPREEKMRFYIIHREALAYIDRDETREFILKIPWKSIIVDECHRFRNLNSLRTQTLLSFNNKNTKFLFLSGTPIVNNVFDLFPILKLIGVENHAGKFLDEYTIGCKTSWGGYKIIGTRNQKKLQEKIAPFYIRRTKEEVLKELPPKQYILSRLIMPDDQRKIYDHYVEMLCLELDSGEELNSPNVLSLFTRLRQISLDPTIIGRKSESSKTRAIKELFEQSPNEKWVICSTSKPYVNHLNNLIEDSITLTGDDSTYERHMKIRKFRENPEIKILLMTMQTGGLGLNLQAASNVIITDPWWNRPTIEQAVDRVHRIGQLKRVLVYELENVNSIDEHMRKIIEQKLEVTETVINTETIKRLYESHRGFSYHKGGENAG